MCLSSLHSKKSIEGMLFSGILIPYPSKLVSGIHKYWFDDPYFCLLYPFIISSTNALISTVYWLLISGCLLRRDVVPYFSVEGYKSDPVLSFFTFSALNNKPNTRTNMYRILLSSYCFVNLPQDGVIKAGWAARENFFALLALLEERLLCVA